MTIKQGGCLCGALRFEAELHKPEFGACHCGMCRKFSGGVFFGMQVKNLRFKDEAALRRYASSDWAERGFCGRCGSSLFYRVTAPGPHHDQHHLAAGTLDDLEALDFAHELFIDRKPAQYAFTGDHPRLTEAQAFAQFGAP